jgi:hypothetical protein
MTMSTPADAPLPPMCDAILDGEQLAALFRDYRACLNGVEILVKRGPGMVTAGSPPTLDEAEQMLALSQARGLQIRYTHDRSQWLDTLMPVAGGVRLVRIAHPASGS